MDSGILSVLRRISKDKKKTAALILACVAISALATGAFAHFIIFMIVIAEIVLSFSMGELDIRNLGIELVTLVTVLSSVIYGPFAGMLIGCVMITARFILTKMLGPYVLYSIPSMMFVGIMGWYMVEWTGDITTTGIILSVVYNAITASLGSLIMKDFFQEILWSGSNIVVNAALFYYVAPIVMAIV